MTEILLPAGRLVQGTVHGLSKNPNNKEDSENFYVAYAIQKTPGVDWSQTDWGAKIKEVGVSGFVGGQYNRPDFAWKVIDGDSLVPDLNGNAPASKAGFPGHWVLRLTTMFVPTLVLADGVTQITQKDYVNLGDYIQALVNVKANGNLQKPGVYLNPTAIAFLGYGERIANDRDFSNVGFGRGPMPQGISQVPSQVAPTQTMAPAPVAAPVPTAQPVAMPPANPAFLQPPTAGAPAVAAAPALPPAAPAPAPVPAKRMTAAANGIPYESYIAQGWTDALLVQHGFMEA